MYTKYEIIDKIYNGSEGSLQVPFEELTTIQKILIDRGYCVLVSHGDIGDCYKINWVYGGDVDSLHYANIDNIVFCNRDYIDMLIDGEYDEENEV